MASSPYWTPLNPGAAGGTGLPGASTGLRTLQSEEQTRPMPLLEHTRALGPGTPPPMHTQRAHARTRTHTRMLRGCTGLSWGAQHASSVAEKYYKHLQPRRQNSLLQGPLRLPRSQEPGEGRTAGGAHGLRAGKEVLPARAVCALRRCPSATDISCLCYSLLQ